MFKTQPGEKLLIFDIQASSLIGGNIDALGLFQGGQLRFASIAEPFTFFGAGSTIGFGIFFKPKLKHNKIGK